MLEMDWTVRYFKHYANKWHALEKDGKSEGHKCYAARTEAMWDKFAEVSKICFDEAMQEELVVKDTNLPIPSLDDGIYM